MNKFNLYLLKLFLKNLFIISLLVLLLQYLSSAYGNLGSLNGYKYNALNFIVLTFYGVILGINQLIPVIIAFATITTIIMLMRSNELLAYMTIGGSISYLSIPLIAVGCFFAVFMLFSEYNIIPKIRVIRENMLDEMKNRPVNASHGYYDIWFVNSNNIITHIGLVSNTEKTIYDIQEYVLNDSGKLNYINQIEKISKINGIWEAYNIKNIDISQNPPKITVIEKSSIDDDTWDKLISIKSTDKRRYSPNELYTVIQLFKEKGINTNELEITLYFKYASAISVIVLILILYPISINFSRNYSIMKNISITFSLCLIFILTQHIFLSLGNKGIFLPIFAIFTPIIMFLCIGLFLIYYQNRPK